MNQLMKKVMTGTWFYDGTVPHIIEVYRTPIRNSKNRYQYTTNNFGREFTLQKMLKWADSQPWGPCKWEESKEANDIILEESSFVDNEEIFTFQKFEILEQVISEVGVWCWWNTIDSNAFQIEFNGPLIYKPSENSIDNALKKMALVFHNPKSISFLSTEDNSDPSDWVIKLNKGECEPLTCDQEYFTLSNFVLMDEILHSVKKIDTTFGYSPKNEQFFKENFQMVFLAQGFGFAISADGFSIHSRLGEITLEQVKELNDSWWDYWKKYWDLKNTPDELLIDYACEVMIPNR